MANPFAVKTDPIDAQAQLARSEAERDLCMQRATAAAATGGATAMVISGATVAALNQFSTKFRTTFGTSGKAAFVVMATGFACWSQGEREMDRTKKEMKGKYWKDSTADH